MPASPPKTSLFIFLLVMVIGSCSKKEGLCELPGADEALRTTLRYKMTKWQENAEFTGIEDFEQRVNKVIDELVIVENNFYRGSDKSCHCEAKIQFADHDDFLKTIAEPMAKIKVEEHPMNSKYLSVKEQISYEENKGYPFFYVMVNQSNQLEALENYPLVTQPQIGNVGDLLFQYMEYQQTGN